ncbi:ion channel [bacterium]|nr:ion channel [bacterium]
MKWSSRIRRLLQFLQRENLHRLMGIVVALIVFGSAGVMIFEPEVTWPQALWLVFATVTTVGYGDISAQTLGGRVVSIVVMIFGIGILGLFTATIASIFVERKMKEDRGMRSFDFENHIIICEWNQRAKDVINELRMDKRTQEAPIILIADLESKPIDDDNLYFIQGSVTEEILKRANLQKANTVVILGDDSLESNARDAKAVLTTLTVETLNPEVYSVVELANEANAQHCERANANEIIVGSEFSSKLLSRATLDHGISKVLSELLSSRYGNDLFKIPVPERLHGKGFLEIFTEMKRENQSTVLAIQRGAEGQVISNPAEDCMVNEGDHLIVISTGGDASG